ncbi:hypothetical protein C7E12_22860, partial [Stenotrophomonas maltophilia]
RRIRAVLCFDLRAIQNRRIGASKRAAQYCGVRYGPRAGRSRRIRAVLCFDLRAIQNRRIGASKRAAQYCGVRY